MKKLLLASAAFGLSIAAQAQAELVIAVAGPMTGQYASFGKVTSGMEYVDKIAETETHSLTDMGMDDVPVQNQIIKTIVIK